MKQTYWNQVNLKLIVIKIHTIIPRATTKKKVGKMQLTKYILVNYIKYYSQVIPLKEKDCQTR